MIHQIEAMVLASDEPITIKKLCELLNHTSAAHITTKDVTTEEVTTEEIAIALQQLETHYQHRGIQFVHVAGGWQFRTAPDHAALVQRLWHTKAPRLSSSVLETLAIIAYRQPTTRAEIEALRSVRVSSHIIATLQERGWIKLLGRKDVPGRPHLYGTGKQFLIDFGLNKLEDLPDSNLLLDANEITQVKNTPINSAAISEQQTFTYPMEPNETKAITTPKT